MAVKSKMPPAAGPPMRAEEPTSEMAFAHHRPIHGVALPDAPMGTIGAAVACMKRHREASSDPAAQALLHQLEPAATRGRAQSEGLLVPPADRGAR